MLCRLQLQNETSTLQPIDIQCMASTLLAIPEKSDWLATLQPQQLKQWLHDLEIFTSEHSGEKANYRRRSKL
ncbi:hypothetical protein RB195_019962 [Necator americanus]|uniref:Uncharacterized protein n=1 Tax=Necator americanus TaxID=51031 RepID=A0ABR1CGK4_NECAM